MRYERPYWIFQSVWWSWALFANLIQIPEIPFGTVQSFWWLAVDVPFLCLAIWRLDESWSNHVTQ